MDNIFLVKYGEIWIKGKNRYLFENRLVSNLKENLKDLGEFVIRKKQSHIYVEPIDYNENYEKKIIERITSTFGIVGVAKVYRTNDKSLENIKELSLRHIKEATKDRIATFKVEAKRADKAFPIISPELASIIGGHILDNTSNLTVDIIKPEICLWVEVREDVYIYSELVQGVGGLPVGTNGSALAMLSGGIDSPVAAWMMAKRGVAVDAIYFHSSPYTSERAKQKVIDLSKKISKYIGTMKLYVVNFTELQLHMREKCRQDALTIIMRRVMFKIAETIAVQDKKLAIITGECVGQVASQTIESIYTTNAATNMPVFRPLIGFDKEDIIRLAKKIDTFDTSILPYEDCCTIFVAKHPQTKPRLNVIENEERKMDKLEELIEEAIRSVEVIEI